MGQPPVQHFGNPVLGKGSIRENSGTFYPEPPIESINDGGSFSESPSHRTNTSTNVLDQTITMNEGSVFKIIDNVGDEVLTKCQVSSICKANHDKEIIVAYTTSPISSCYDLKDQKTKRAFRHNLEGTVHLLKWRNLQLFFEFPRGPESTVKIFVGETPIAIGMKPFKATYLQPDYSRPGTVFEGLAFSRNVMVYGGNHLLYTGMDKKLVMYDLAMIERFSKGGEPDEPVELVLPSSIQAFDFLSKTFTQDRICALTSDGRIIKIICSSNKLSIKREATIPDAIDPNVLFTDIVTYGDRVFVSGFDITSKTNTLILLSRDLQLVTRAHLKDQGILLSYIKALMFTSCMHLNQNPVSMSCQLPTMVFSIWLPLRTIALRFWRMVLIYSRVSKCSNSRSY